MIAPASARRRSQIRLRQRRRCDRLFGHWHDVVRLDVASIVDNALAQAAARHESMFFKEKDAVGRRNDHKAAVTGALRLVSAGSTRAALADDHVGTLVNRMLLDDSESFEAVVERCATQGQQPAYRRRKRGWRKRRERLHAP